LTVLLKIRVERSGTTDLETKCNVPEDFESSTNISDKLHLFSWTQHRFIL